jgi:hypothetical protein
MKKTGPLLILLAFLFSSCALFLPYGTSSWINRKLDRTPAGSSQEEVLKHFGRPIYQIKFPDAVEIWGYDLGHYWYHEMLPFFFRDGRFIGVPRSSYELFVFMHQHRLIDGETRFIARAEG